MPEEKRPRIDLKARLGKTAQAPPASGPNSGAPIPASSGIPMGVRSVPAPISSVPGVSVPGVPVGPPPAFGSQPPSIDPRNPLAAVAVPYRPSMPAQAMQPRAQRIEVDDMAVQTASRSAVKKGFVGGSILAVFVGIIGFVAGQSKQTGDDRSKSRNDAQELSSDATKARDALKTLAEKMEAGAKTMAQSRKFPDTLSRELGGINVDFDGTKLVGRRFSAFSPDAARDVVDLITSVQAVNDRKRVVLGLLNRLQAPITAQLSAPQGQQTVSYVVAVDKDPSGNVAGMLSALSAPITVTSQNISLPALFKFGKPGGGGTTELPRYTGGDVATKPAAIYIVPKTFEAVCPSATAGQIAQMGAQMTDFVREIRGEQQVGGSDVVQDSKPGLLERADKVIAELNKI